MRAVARTTRRGPSEYWHFGKAAHRQQRTLCQGMRGAGAFAAGPSRALAVTFLAPMFALLYGALLLGERITPWMLGGGAVIVLGTALSTGLLRFRR